MKAIKSIVLLLASILLVACGGGDDPPLNTVTVKAATVAPPSNSSIFSFGSMEVGRFAIVPENTGKVTGLSFGASGSLTSLTSIVGLGSIRLEDVATGTQISARTTVTGNSVSFDGMSYEVRGGNTTNLKVILTTAGSLSVEMGRTLKLSLTEIRFDTLTEVSGLPLTLKEYVVQAMPPTISMIGNTLDQTRRLAVIRMTNTDHEESLSFESISVTAMFRSTTIGIPAFTGRICLRLVGANTPCTTTGEVVTQSGGTFRLMLPPEINTILVSRGGGTMEVEIYLEGAPVWVVGDFVSLSLNELVARSGTGATMPYSYIGNAGASLTLSK